MNTTKHTTHIGWIDDLQPDDMRDATRLRKIGEALTALERAQHELDRAVNDAHEAGESWSAIAVVLGTSKQAAHRKFARPQKAVDAATAVQEAARTISNATASSTSSTSKIKSHGSTLGKKSIVSVKRRRRKLPG